MPSLHRLLRRADEASKTTDTNPSGSSEWIKGLSNGAAVAIFIIIALVVILIPTATYIFIRRRRMAGPGAHYDTDGRIGLVAAVKPRTPRRSSTETFDSFMDEIKRPERVVSFREAWDREGGTLKSVAGLRFHSVRGFGGGGN